MGTTPTTRRLVPGLALLAASLLLVACGTGVTGTAAPGPATAGPATAASSTSSPTTAPSVTMSTVDPSGEATTESVRPAPDRSVPVPSVPVPSVPVPSVPVPSVPVPADPVPSPPATEPAPAGEPAPVDPEVYWAAAVDAYAWTSPSGNILCLLQPELGTVGCAAFEHSIAPAPDCFPDQPFVAELGPDGVVQGCTGDVPYSGAVLPYGDAISVGALTCSSSPEGMICDNGDLAFILSRDALELAG